MKLTDIIFSYLLGSQNKLAEGRESLPKFVMYLPEMVSADNLPNTNPSRRRFFRSGLSIRLIPASKAASAAPPGPIVAFDGLMTNAQNDSIYIPIGSVHRLANQGRIPLELIEVQTGSYLGEDDIIRLEDIYRRVNS